MNVIASSPEGFRAAGRLGLWGLATWSVLNLHDVPFAGDHSICGPWGCGPTIPALVAAHGFWLVVLIPAAFFVGRRLDDGKATALGRACVGLGFLGLLVVSLLAWIGQPDDRRPGARAYTAERILFAVATTVEVPAVPVALAGLALLTLGRRPPSVVAAPEPANPGDGTESCEDGSCSSPASRAADLRPRRIEVGELLPTLTLRDQDGGALRLPADLPTGVSVVYLMRSAGCSICRKHVRALVEMRERHAGDKPDVIVIHPGSDATSRALAAIFSGALRFTSGGATGAYDVLGLNGRGSGIFRGSGFILVDGRGIVRSARLGILPLNSLPEIERSSRT